MMISRISHINSKNALRRVFCGSGVEMYHASRRKMDAGTYPAEQTAGRAETHTEQTEKQVKKNY